MVDRKTMLEDIRNAGGCEYCKRYLDETKYYTTKPFCKGDCRQCEIIACACNNCVNMSKWEYFRE